MIPTSLDDNIIYQSGKFVKIFQDLMDSEFRKAGFSVTPEQFNILVHLWYRDGLSQQELAELVGRDKTTVSRVLDNMLKQKLLKKSPGKDKRERRIHLTKKGKEMQSNLVNLSGSLYLKAIGTISDKKLLSAIKTLQQLTKNVT